MKNSNESGEKKLFPDLFRGRDVKENEGNRPPMKRNAYRKQKS
jgi:hypothetical protein